MTKGTTPTITFHLPDTVDLTLAENVYATLTQGSLSVCKSGDALTVTAHSVSLDLSQEETLSFLQGVPAMAQLNWVYEDGKRGCSNIVNVFVHDNLERRVLP